MASVGVFFGTVECSRELTMNDFGFVFLLFVQLRQSVVA